MRKILTLTIGGFLPIIAYAHVHTAHIKPDQILLVKTALGIATIVEAPETIQSAIIGDQSGFKVEYLDRAVTIKPLRFGARTNLYLQTQSRRYNLKLETNRQEIADYIVYLKATDARPTLVWRDISRTTSGKVLTLKAVRRAALQHGFLLFDFRLSSKSKIKLSPEGIWLRQGKESKVINGLFLSRLEVSKDRPTLMGLTLSKSDLANGRPIEVSIKAGSETVSLELPAEVVWK